MRLSFTTLASLFFLLLLSIAAYLHFVRSGNLPAESDVASSTASSTIRYECSADGRMCPDGSVVGRTGPRCEFSECPGVMPAGTTTTSHATAILYGRVTLSPICPVERNPPDPACAPKAYVTDVAAIDATTGKDVGATTRTTSNGTFIMDLPPGSYIIRAKSAPVYPRCGDVSVKVYANSSSSIAIACDSGIR
jgi:hypothetical protein